MIEIFQGRIGGGKTYTSVLRAAAHCKRGGHVYSNVELVRDGFEDLCRERFSFEVDWEQQIHSLEAEQIPKVHKHIAGGEGIPTLVIVDEAQLFYNSRDWASADKGMLTLLTQSRKVGVDFIWITQAASNIDKQFRVLSQYVWGFKDLRRFWSWCPLDAILCLCFDIDGRLLIRWHLERKDKLVFRAYNTNALLKPIDWGGEKVGRVQVKTIKKKLIPDNPEVALIALMSAVVLLIAKIVSL